MIADHRRHPGEVDCPLILAGQRPALGHRCVRAQRHAVVPAVSRKATKQRHREESDARPGHRHSRIGNRPMASWLRRVGPDYSAGSKGAENNHDGGEQASRPPPGSPPPYRNHLRHSTAHQTAPCQAAAAKVAAVTGRDPVKPLAEEARHKPAAAHSASEPRAAIQGTRACCCARPRCGARCAASPEPPAPPRPP